MRSRRPFPPQCRVEKIRERDHGPVIGLVAVLEIIAIEQLREIARVTNPMVLRVDELVIDGEPVAKGVAINDDRQRQ